MGLYEGYPERIETQVLVTDKEDLDGDENGYPSQDFDDYSELTDEMEDGGLSQFFK
jgi:hypothetical protein